MNSYLDQTRVLLSSTKPLIIILGNESCDLDSAVSALSLAYHFHINISAKSEYCNKTHEVAPVLNIRKQDLPLKTEIIYFFKQNNIDPMKIICLDEVNKSMLDSSYYVLVDHHVSAFHKQVLFVIDHRPFDTQSNLPENCKKIINQVGSCATLVFDLINKSNLENVHKPCNEYKAILNLIYGTIVLDTVNFSKTADKFRQIDVDAVELIENILQFNDTATTRATVFNNLVDARADVGSLNSLQILSKDMKLLKNDKNGKCVAIPGYPILVQEYIKMLNAEVSVKQFCDFVNCDVIVLMGMKITKDQVRRDIGIINFKDAELFEKIVNEIVKNTELDLQLTTYHDAPFLNGKFFEAGNVRPSRKQILPLIKRALDEVENSSDNC